MINVVVIEKGKVYFTAPFAQAKKQCWGYQKSTNCSWVYKNHVALRGLLSCDPTNDKLHELYAEELNNYAEILASKELEDCAGSTKLRPYQRVDVNYINKLDNPLIFNQQRTGKTPSCLVALREKGAAKAIVVCPPHLKAQWAEEIETWTNLNATVIRGTAKKRKDAWDMFKAAKSGVAVVGYESLRSDSQIKIGKTVKYTLCMKLDALIVDEGHRLRNTDTGQSKAVAYLGKLAARKYVLTGTPTANHASEIYGILHFAYPTIFSSKWDFINYFFETHEGHFGKEIGNLKKEPEWLVMLNMYAINRKRKDVMKWLPKVDRPPPVISEMTDAQTKYYDEMLNTFTVGEIDAQTVMTQLLRLRQINLDPAILNLKGRGGKTEWLLGYVEDNPNTPIIITSSFTSYLKYLKGLIPQAELMTGEQSDIQKNKVKNGFQNGEFNILLANTLAVGTGYKLDRAEVLIFTDRNVTPMNNEQMEARFLPTTEEDASNSSKTIIDLVVDNDTDRWLMNLLREKSLSTELVNSFKEKIAKTTCVK